MATAANACVPETQKPGAGRIAPGFANHINRSAIITTLPPAEGQPGPIIARHWWRASEMEAYHV